MTESPKTLHRVTFEVEDGCAMVTKVTCLSDPGAWCRVGCPVMGCEWDHDEEGCDHCLEMCACDCSTHLDGVCTVETGPCTCATREEHQQGSACPHTFHELDDCWVLPWVENGESDWLASDAEAWKILRDDVIKGRDAHPVEVWELDMSDIDGERYEWWGPTGPVRETLRRVS